MRQTTIAVFIAGAALSANAADELKPEPGERLRDAAVTRAPDGTYYLTGTLGTPDKFGRMDFDYNPGVPLWRSADLKTWQSLGLAWNRAEHFTRAAGRPKPGLWLDWSAPAGRIDALLSQATTTPSLCRIGRDWYLVCAMNGQNILLQKSAAGNPEGPYDDFAYLATRGGHPSLFVDDDPTTPAGSGAAGGTGYWVVGQGWLAKLKPDWTGLAERPQLLRCAPFPAIPHGVHEMASPHAPRYLGAAGAHVFKADGRYYLIGAAVRDRIGVGCYDTFVAFADKLTGPYGSPHLMIPHGGQTTVFKGPDQQWWATFAGRDSRAVFRDRPAMVPLEFGTDVLYGRATKSPFPRKKAGLVTEFGPWDKAPKATPYKIRDLQCIFAPGVWVQRPPLPVDHRPGLRPGHVGLGRRARYSATKSRSRVSGNPVVESHRDAGLQVSFVIMNTRANCSGGSHASASLCTPSRYSLLTGRYSWRSPLREHVGRTYGSPLIAADRLTLPGLLKRRGYHTACLGKWHLGWNWPLRQKDGSIARAPRRQFLIERQGEPVADEETRRPLIPPYTCLFHCAGNHQRLHRHGVAPAALRAARQALTHSSMTQPVRAAVSPVLGQFPATVNASTTVWISGCWTCSGMGAAISWAPDGVSTWMGSAPKIEKTALPREPTISARSNHTPG
jgi:hypothetical protein